MKKIFIVSFLLILMISLTGCKEETYNYKVRVRESSWSGWTPDYKIEEKTNEYDAILDRVYLVNNGDLTFAIIEIKKDYVVIKTTEPFSDKEEGIDLNTTKTEFKVYFDKELKLTTPTTDAGNIYYLQLVK